MVVVEGATQALIAAFGFGTVVNAASAALFLYTKGHGSTFFKDGLRLVLIIFLLSSALWAQIDFITLILDIKSSSMPCQVGIIFATIFDQLGRFSIEQYLAWALNNGTKMTAGQMIPQVLILVRLIAGGVFVGFTRPQTDTFCVATSSVLPVAITVIVLDVVVLLLLTARAFSTGLFADIQKKRTDSARSKSLMLVMLGLAIWTATSVTLLLGIKTTDLVVRTAVPAGGLTVLIIIVTGCVETLATPRATPSRPPEAPSPRRINISRDVSSSDSDYPPSRYEDLKEAAIRSSTAFVNPREVPRFQDEAMAGLPAIPEPVPPVPAFPVVGVNTVLISSNPPAPIRANTAPMGGGARKLEAPGSVKRSMFGSVKGGPAAAVYSGRLVISNPILQGNDARNPLNKIATMDLEEAAKAERERRAKLQRNSSLVATRPAPQPPNVSQEENLKRAMSVKRKEVASVSSQTGMVQENLMPQRSASTTSAQLSPGIEEVRRRSPRQPPAAEYPTAPVPVPVPVPVPEPVQIYETQEPQPWPESPPQEPPRARSPPQVPRANTPPQQAPRSVTPERMPSQRQQAPRAVTPEQIAAQRQQAPRATPPEQAPIQRPQAARAITPEQIPVLRPEIRPSRQAPPSPKAPPPEPTKTPLQRRPTNGLPSNPRSRGLKVAQEAADTQRQQTVLFVNDIVYNDPNTVRTIINGANTRATKTAPIPETPGTSNSVVNRPRPIPRKGTDPTSPALKHRRSRSGGSLMSRKSILMSNPGSPTQLPPLPLLPPKSAGPPGRPHPNDTKSMTVDEKMRLLFPNPPSGNTAKRRSSVPELPPVPASYDNMASSPGQSDRRNSNRTTKTSIQTESILDVDELPGKKPEGFSRFSPNTEHNIADEGDSWMPDIPSERGSSQARSRQASTDTGKRASSPVIPVRSSAWTESSDTRTHDDATTNWGSERSPELAVGIQVARRVARTTNIQKGDRQNSGELQVQNVPPAESRNPSQLMTVMLDTSSTGQRPPYPRESWLTDGENMLVPERASQLQWHRRVGDECPTFSERKEKMRSRMPPPTPLLLNATKQPVVVYAEPSPVESPEQALKQIQEQLKKYEQPNRDSVESQAQRLALLENLEKEMGMQEDHWQEMKHDLGRDSLSSLQTASPITTRNSRVEPVAPVANTLSRESSGRSSIGLIERRASRRARIRTSGASVATTAAEGASQTNNGGGGWQKRLADAEMDFMDRTADMPRRPSVNFLTMPKAAAHPTPPDSESDDDVPPVPQIAAITARPVVKRPSLWTPAPKSTNPSPLGMTWTPRPKDATAAQSDEPVFPNASVRPPPRKNFAPLTIGTSELWRKPYVNTSRSRSSTGLWRPSWASAAPPAEPVARSQKQRPTSLSEPQPQDQKAPRPLTQRPPRRNKRVTLLPDIIENPEPLPDKRGTLGIFQFPWGERSDTASIFFQPQQQRPMFMAMPGTMASAGRARQQAEATTASAEYSSSFFDDYDDDNLDYEGEGEGEGDSEGDDDDDGFDETTLWEIASLLKTENSNVPSKNSLFPLALNTSSSLSIVDDYINEIPSDGEEEEEEEERERQSIMIVPIGIEELELPVTQALERERNGGGESPSPLWSGKKKGVGVEKKGHHGKGLPQDRVWEKVAEVVSSEAVRSKPRTAAQPAVIESSTLWQPEGDNREVKGSALLWSPAGKQTQQLWSGRQRTVERGGHGKGLPHDNSTWERLASSIETVRAKPRKASPAAIESSTLWTSQKNSKEVNGLAPLWSPKQTKRLWAGRRIVKKGGHGKGLPHDSSWERLAGSVETVRAKPRKAEQPAVIASSTLWKPQGDNKEANGTAPLWSPKRGAERAKQQLWTGRRSVKKSMSGHGKGLPHGSSWERLAASMETVRTKPRKVQPTEVPVIESGNLWELRHEAKAKESTQLWTALEQTRHAEHRPSMIPRLTSAQPTTLESTAQPHKASHTPRSAGEQPAAGLWNRRPSSPQSEGKEGGMFKVGHDRSSESYRTTELEPAAKDMRRKPRQTTLEKPLGRLSSANIWNKTSSPRKAPTNRSEGLWSRSAIASVNVKRREVSAAEWDAALQEAISLSYPRKKLVRRVVTSAEWDAALQEAISLSYPRKKLVRRAVTSAEWDAALHEAIVLSTRPPVRAFDPAVRHPVFAASSLVSDSEWAHPAATGYTYDTAHVHPVFFGSMTYSCPDEAVHPAFAGYGPRSEPEQEEQVEEVFDPAIQAQIEALEQERLFVQRAALEDYNRRITVYGEPLAHEPVPEPVYEPVPEPVYEPVPEPVYEPVPEPVYEPVPEPVYEPVPAEPTVYEPWMERGYEQTSGAVEFVAPQTMGVRTLLDLQRHLESQALVRQSIYWTDNTGVVVEEAAEIVNIVATPRFSSPAAPPAAATPPVPAVVREQEQLAAAPPAEEAQREVVQTRRARTTPPTTNEPPPAASGSMWTPTRTTTTQNQTPSKGVRGLWTPGQSTITLMEGGSREDAESEARRARRRRKDRQAEVEMGEVLAGRSPKGVNFGEQQRMWTRGSNVNGVKGGQGRDWLHDAAAHAERRVSRVTLRY